MNSVQPYVTDNGVIKVKSIPNIEAFRPDASWIRFLRSQILVMFITKELAEIVFEVEMAVTNVYNVPRERKQHYEYLEVEVESNITQTANSWASDGWEVVSVISPMAGSPISLLLKRVKIDV